MANGLATLPERLTCLGLLEDPVKAWNMLTIEDQRVISSLSQSVLYICSGEAYEAD